MKNNVIIFITDLILDPEIGKLVCVEQYFSGMTRIIVDPQTNRWVSSDTNSSVFVLRNKGYPSFMTSWSNTTLVVAMLDLWSLRQTGAYENYVYELANHLEDKVSSSLHLAKLT
ncbi:hypothetical protein K1719_044660 [Acacia pycnantha]|nr:hypothetical protein K1719_044660 [Acacia pycnantha]